MNNPKSVTAIFEKKFYLAENGLTVKCPKAGIGESGTLNGVIYTKRSKSQITTSNAPTTCTSGITDMRSMFESADSFNSDISSWDVSAVTIMSNMFLGATSFTGDLSNWDVSSVTDMNRMFRYASNFNGDISSWDVSAVTNMYGMFEDMDSFNGDISSWDVSSVTDMSYMFSYADSFNGDLSGWCVSDNPSHNNFAKNSAFEGKSNLMPDWGAPCSQWE